MMSLLCNPFTHPTSISSPCHSIYLFANPRINIIIIINLCHDLRRAINFIIPQIMTKFAKIFNNTRQRFRKYNILRFIYACLAARIKLYWSYCYYFYYGGYLGFCISSILHSSCGSATSPTECVFHGIWSRVRNDVLFAIHSLPH